MPIFPNVDNIISQCPSLEEVSAINEDLALYFDSDPTSGTLVCSAEQGSVNLTLLQKNTYRVFAVMQQVPFTEPLPWTPLPLYEWFVNAVEGVRFSDQTEVSFCCEDGEIIVVQTSNLVATRTNRWIPPDLGVGVGGLMVLLVHEARHNEGPGHDCLVDANLAAMGSWAVQYYLYEWMVYHTTPEFFTAREPYGDYYRELYVINAADIRNTRFCAEATTTPGPLPTFPSP
jgi:hypothetical protein